MQCSNEGAIGTMDVPKMFEHILQWMYGMTY
jgi:hypothetical protein